MIEKLKNLGWKQFGGLVLIVIIIIAFGFGGFGGGFSTNNQNNIAKINKPNVTTQDFMDYVNQSGISADAIRNNLDNNIIEELLSGLISTALIDLEVKDFDISINKKTILNLFFLLVFENFITLSSEFRVLKSPNIFQLATKYIYLFVIIDFLIYRFVFYRSINL